MEKNSLCNTQDQIDHWVSKIKSEPSITESDSEELKSHLFDSIDQLKDTGLNDEEAFLIASRRLGTTSDWEEDYRQVNNQVIQFRRSVLILAGVLVYFCLYYFLKFSTKLLFILLMLKKTDGYIAVNWVSRLLVGAHVVVFLFVFSLYLMKNKIISFIENVKIRPKHTLLLLFTTIIFGITDTCLDPITKNLTSQYITLRSNLHHIFIYFDFSFPLLICLCFIFTYFKYYKKAKF